MGEVKDVVPFKTVKEYQEYMKGEPDNDKTQRHNPPPTDGLTLLQLGKMNDAEILAIINKMGQIDNKSDIRVMYCNGYSFSWTELNTIANFRGYINTTPGQRKVIYALPDDNIQISPADNSMNKIEFSRDIEAYPVEKKLYLSKEAAEKLKFIFIKGSTGKPYENSVKSRILSAITEKAIEETYRQKKAGKLKIIAKEIEL